MELYCYKAKVQRVIDGDTFIAVVDAGFDLTTRQRFRMLGINAPEMKSESKPEGEKAKDYLRSMIEGQDVVIQSHEKDVFGRWLCTVWMNGVNVNKRMLKEGQAKVYVKGED